MFIWTLSDIIDLILLGILILGVLICTPAILLANRRGKKNGRTNPTVPGHDAKEIPATAPSLEDDDGPVTLRSDSIGRLNVNPASLRHLD